VKTGRIHRGDNVLEMEKIPRREKCLTSHTLDHRHVKLDFPQFNGEEDLTSWVCRVEQFFRFQGTTEEDKVALASFHLEGEAQLWFQILLREGREIGWPEFKEGVFAHFGPTQFYDPFGEFTKLQQEGGIRDYQAKFKSLLSKIGTLSQSQHVSCFVSGLKKVIKVDVTVGRPLILTSAIGLARVYEACNMALKKHVPFETRRPPLTPRSTMGQPPLPIKRLTLEELKERQEKGLCFKGNEKYSPGHRCKKLFMIEAYLREDEDGDVMAQDEEEEDTLEISLHAITGKDAPDTIKVYGRIGQSIFLALIDSGSIHNFMSLAHAHLLKLQPAEEGGGMDVIIASGEKIRSPGKCVQIPVELQVRLAARFPHPSNLPHQPAEEVPWQQARHLSASSESARRQQNNPHTTGSIGDSDQAQENRIVDPLARPFTGRSYVGRSRYGHGSVSGVLPWGQGSC